MEETFSSAEKFRAEADVVNWVENTAISLKSGNFKFTKATVQNWDLQQRRFILLFAAIYVKKVDAKLRNSFFITWNEWLSTSSGMVLEAVKDLVSDVSSTIEFAKDVCQEMQSKIRQSLAGFRISDALVQEFVDRVTESGVTIDSSLESTTQAFLNLCSSLYNACRKNFPELDFTAANEMNILSEFILGLDFLLYGFSIVEPRKPSGGNGAPGREARTQPTGMHQSDRLLSTSKAGHIKEEIHSSQRNREATTRGTTRAQKGHNGPPARGSSPSKDSTGSVAQPDSGTYPPVGGSSSAVQSSGQKGPLKEFLTSTTQEKFTSKFDGFKAEEITDPRRPSVLAKRYGDLFFDSSDLVLELEKLFPESLDSGKIAAERVLQILTITYERAILLFEDLWAQVEAACALRCSEVNFRGQKKIKIAVKEQNRESVKNKADLFLKKCISLCWDMILRKQRLILVADDKVFTSSHHEHLAGESTRGSKDINYFAWPCLIEEETNRVLLKGKVVTKAKEMMRRN